jgi:hypothetical protein
MQDITWVAVVGVLLLIGQVVSIYNSISTAKKNAGEPLNIVKTAVTEQGRRITEIEHEMTDVKKDLNHAFDKIRENKEESERTAKAQNAALVQILLLLKEPNKKNDKAIDDTIKELTSI